MPDYVLCMKEIEKFPASAFKGDIHWKKVVPHHRVTGQSVSEDNDGFIIPDGIGVTGPATILDPRR